MKKAIVFPYSNEFKPVMDYSQILNSEFDIKALIAPKGWRLDGTEVPYRKYNIEGQYL